jgi:hypothetical protein
VVSWKSDGDRYLVAVLPFGTFGINRKKEVGDLALPYFLMRLAPVKLRCPI